MLYLLDTNAISDLTREHPQVSARLAALRPEDRVITSVIAAGEVLFGLARLPDGQKKQRIASKVAQVLAQLPKEPVSIAAANRYADLKSEAQRAGVVASDNDFWIAATALELNAIVVTRDADLGRLGGVNVEDWTK